MYFEDLEFIILSSDEVAAFGKKPEQHFGFLGSVSRNKDFFRFRSRDKNGRDQNQAAKVGVATARPEPCNQNFGSGVF